MKARVIVLLSALLFLIVFCYFSTASNINVLAGEKTAVRGKIKEVNPELKMVVMGLGSKHGLKENTVVFIYRDGEKVGVVRILNVLSEHDSNGRIIEGEGLKVGDTVSLESPVPGPPRKGVSSPGTSAHKDKTPLRGDPPAKPAEKTLAERVADLEKRVRELEKLLEATPPLKNEPVAAKEETPTDTADKSTARSAPGTSGEFDKTVDSMLKEPKKKAGDTARPAPNTGETGSKDKADPADPQRKFIVTDKGLEAENPEGTPLITGKVLGPYNKNKEIGIFLGKGHKAKRGYIFFIYRGSGEELKLVAKIKVEDILADIVGGPILIQYDVVRETDQASTRMPEGE
jgi:hypothetical protein